MFLLTISFIFKINKLSQEASRNATKLCFELHWDFHVSDKHIVTMSFGSLYMRC